MPFAAELFAYVTTYGYLAIFLGAFFEGETLLILGGLFSHQGHLSFPVVLLLAFIGTLMGDAMWFLVGRYRIPHFIHSRNWFRRLSAQPLSLVEGRQEFLAFSMRFMYGFRTLIPLGLGMSTIPARTFFIYNALGGVLWVLVYGSLGYFFGQLLETLFGRIRHFELILIAVVIFFVVAFITIGRYLRRYFGKKLDQEPGGEAE